MGTTMSTSTGFWLVVVVVAAAAGVAVVESAQVIGDVEEVMAESDAERWTDISAKKLESQKAAHEREYQVDWKGLDQPHTREQPRLNKVHAAHAQKNVLQVELRDAEGIEEINLGGVRTSQTKSPTASVMMVVVLGLVAFVAVIGVIRFRASRNGAAGNDAANGAMGGDDYHWVDELNIIVNPMEEQGSSGGVDEEDQELPLRDDFSEDSEMSDREMDLEQGDLEDLSTEDEDEMPGVTIATAAGVKELRSCRGLEWDDSTI